MIEQLGIGAPREDGGWRLHRVCATFGRGEVTLVVSYLPEERDALVERVGLGGRELETASRLGTVDRARLAIASALVSAPGVLVVREVDRGFDGTEALSLRSVLQSLARRERLAVLAGAATPAAAIGFADRRGDRRRPPGLRWPADRLPRSAGRVALRHRVARPASSEKFLLIPTVHRATHRLSPATHYLRPCNTKATIYWVRWAILGTLGRCSRARPLRFGLVVVLQCGWLWITVDKLRTSAA